MKKTKKMMTRLTAYAAALLLFAACSITAFADAEGTVIPGSAKVRSSADTSSEAVASVKSNDKLTITGKTTGADGQTWYQIVDGNTKGYIRADLVKVNGTVEGSAGSDATVTQTQADVQPADVSSGSVNSSSVNIRKGPATTDAVAASAKQGTVVTILGQTTGADGKNWYQVSFNSNGSDVTGFVRADLIEASAAPAKDENTEATETEAAEGEGTEAEDGTESETPVQDGYTEVSNVVSSRILPGEADLSKMEIDESKLAEWESGNYYLLYATDTKGGKYWYLYDLSNKQCTKINNLAGGDEEQSAASDEGFGTTAKIVIAVLAVLVIALIVTVTMLLLKLRDLQWDEEYEDEEEEYYGEDDEEIGAYEEGRVNSRRWKPRNFLNAHEEEYEDEEEEIEEEPVRPVRRRPVQGGGQQGNTAHGVSEGQRPAAPRQGAAPRREAAPRQGSVPRGDAAQRPAAPEGQRVRRPAGQAQAAPGAEARTQGNRRPAGQPVQRPAARPQGTATRGDVIPGQPQAASDNREERPRRRPVQAAGAMQEEPKERPARPSRPVKPQPQPAYYEEDEDDEFEFEFLNMDGKDDL
ncbi:MAG: SH3 domain-containing protein [Clostridiales bacterium]|nr:SH3 domain-containing protein [Clostridiales bacterium]